jgi:hypothetical protein
LLLLEAVASLDIEWCQKILERYENEHRANYLDHPQTLLSASTRKTDDSTLYPAVVDLINNTRDEDGYSPLNLAFQSSSSEHGAIPMIQYLISMGGNVNSVPQRVRSRIQWEKKQKPICESYHRENFKQSFLLNVWEEEEEKVEKSVDTVAKKTPCCLLPSMNSASIEREKYKNEPKERGDLFYQRKVQRGNID